MPFGCATPAPAPHRPPAAARAARRVSSSPSTSSSRSTRSGCSVRVLRNSPHSGACTRSPTPSSAPVLIAEDVTHTSAAGANRASDSSACTSPSTRAVSLCNARGSSIAGSCPSKDPRHRRLVDDHSLGSRLAGIQPRAQGGHVGNVHQRRGQRPTHPSLPPPRPSRARPPIAPSAPAANSRDTGPRAPTAPPPAPAPPSRDAASDLPPSLPADPSHRTPPSKRTPCSWPSRAAPDGQLKTDPQLARPARVQRHIRPRKRKQHAPVILGLKPVRRRQDMQRRIKKRRVNPVIPAPSAAPAGSATWPWTTLPRRQAPRQSLECRPVVQTARAQSGVEIRHVQRRGPRRRPILQQRDGRRVASPATRQHTHGMAGPAARPSCAASSRLCSESARRPCASAASTCTCTRNPPLGRNHQRHRQRQLQHPRTAHRQPRRKRQLHHPRPRQDHAAQTPCDPPTSGCSDSDSRPLNNSPSLSASGDDTPKIACPVDDNPSDGMSTRDFGASTSSADAGTHRSAAPHDPTRFLPAATSSRCLAHARAARPTQRA